MNILVISVHPDDETLGCGGTILKHKDIGDNIFWLVITSAYENLGFSKEYIKIREEQIKVISSIYGCEKVYGLGYPTTKLHMVDLNEFINKVSDIIIEIKPDIVYTNNRSDIHTDHQISSKVIISCTKSFRYPFIKKILMYECLSETEMAPPFPESIFVPNVFSDITEYIDKKIDIMKVYESEVQSPPLPRNLKNIRALARYRGSTCGVDYAEAFMLVRERF